MSRAAACAAAEPVPAARVDELVRDVLAGGEFHPGAVERVWERLADWIGGAFGLDGPDLGSLIAVVVWIALAGALLAFGVLLVRSLLRSRRSRAAGGAAGAPDVAAAREARVAELLRRAREAEAAGDLVLALRLSFFAAVVGLGDAGALEYRDAWTNRELFERGRPSRAVRERLAPLVDELDRKSFGREPVRVEDVHAMQRLGAALLAGGAA